MGRQFFQIHSGDCLPSKEACLTKAASGTVSGAREQHTGPENAGKTNVFFFLSPCLEPLREA